MARYAKKRPFGFLVFVITMLLALPAGFMNTQRAWAAAGSFSYEIVEHFSYRYDLYDAKRNPDGTITDEILTLLMTQDKAKPTGRDLRTLKSAAGGEVEPSSSWSTMYQAYEKAAPGFNYTSGHITGKPSSYTRFIFELNEVADFVTIDINYDKDKAFMQELIGSYSTGANMVDLFNHIQNRIKERQDNLDNLILWMNSNKYHKGTANNAFSKLLGDNVNGQKNVHEVIPKAGSTSPTNRRVETYIKSKEQILKGDAGDNIDFSEKTITNDLLAGKNIPSTLPSKEQIIAEYLPGSSLGGKYQEYDEAKIQELFIMATFGNLFDTINYPGARDNSPQTVKNVLNYGRKYVLGIRELKIPVSYEFVDKTNPETSLPDELVALTPKLTEEFSAGASVTGIKVGDTYTKQDGTQDQFKDSVTLADGSQWTFHGYTTDNTKTNTESVETEHNVTAQYNDNSDPAINKFVGVWEMTSEPVPPTPTTAPVTYEFVGKDNVELPQEIKDLLPGNERHEIGTSAIAQDPSKDQTPVKELTVGEYDWKFNGYTHNGKSATELVVQDGENKFVGEWERLYKVNYKYNYPDKEEDDHKVVSKISNGGSTGDNHPDNPTRPDGPAGKKWTFVGWHKDKTHDPNDETGMFTGTTTITDNTVVYAIWKEQDKEAISYEYQKAQGVDIDLPAVINTDEFLPTSHGSEHYVGDSVRADRPKKETYQDDTGTWTFTNYEKDSLEVAKGQPNKFIGYWSYAIDTTQYTHRYESGTQGMTLPEMISKTKAQGGLTPNAQTGNLGETVHPTQPDTDEYKVEDGKWTFSGTYTPDQLTLIRQGTHEFVGLWNFVKKVTYSYRYEKAPEVEKELPAAIQNLRPDVDSTRDHYVGDSVNAEAAMSQTYQDAEGTWTFKEYEKDALQLVDGTNEFVGYWSYAPDTVPYTHEFVADPAANKPLPEVLTKKVADNGLIPDDQEGNLGTQVQPTQPTQTEVLDEDGKWTFQGYDKPNLTLSRTGENKFVGTWSYTLKTTYSYRYVAAQGVTESLPAEIQTYAPAVSGTHYVGDSVDAENPTQTTHQTDKGTWTFVGYTNSPLALTSTEADNVLIGEWTYAVDTVPYTHRFVSGTPDKQLPVEIANKVSQDPAGLTPDDQNGNIGTTVTPTQPGETVVEVEGGKWTFTGYNKPDMELVRGDNEFVGTWTFQEVIPATPIVPLYSVIYQFESEDKTTPLPAEITKRLPSKEGSKLNGSKVNPAPVADTTYEEYIGNGEVRVWSFKGWDKGEETVKDGDVIYTGTWSYKLRKPATPLTYFVIHKFTTSDGSPVPQEVMKYLPPTVGGHANGSEVTPSELETTRIEVPQEDGSVKIWTFKSWDKDHGTINNDNVVFTGAWEPSDPDPVVPDPDPNPTPGPDPVVPDPDPNPTPDPKPVKPVMPNPGTPGSQAPHKLPKTGAMGAEGEASGLASISILALVAGLIFRRKKRTPDKS